MGIKSTKDVSRDWALGRIEKIRELALNCDYAAIEEITCDPHYTLDEEQMLQLTKITEGIMQMSGRCTNRILGNVLDKPFIRESMFDNYLVHDDDK